MGFLNRLFGRDEPEEARGRVGDRSSAQWVAPAGAGAASDDERAVERYRYLLRTAPPETIEQAHAEAFAQLTPEQRRLVLDELTQTLPERERAAAGQGQDDPRSLARLATRAEMRRGGTLERTFGGMRPTGAGLGGGIGMGGLLAGGFLSSIAGVVVGSAIADAFFADSNGDGSDGGGDDGDGNDGSDAGDGGDPGDTGDTGDGAADFGDLGDIGGDFGGEF